MSYGALGNISLYTFSNANENMYIITKNKMKYKVTAKALLQSDSLVLKYCNALAQSLFCIK